MIEHKLVSKLVSLNFISKVHFSDFFIIENHECYFVNMLCVYILIIKVKIKDNAEK